MDNASDIQATFLSSIRSVLWNTWDPIGLNVGNDDLDDEYDSYALEVYALAMNDEAASVISAELMNFSSKQIQIPACRDNADRSARIIVNLKRQLFSQ